MKKNLEYYLNLNYPIEINKLSAEEGGGYIATIPQLGKYAFVGDGETIEEAIKNLEEVKEILFKKYLKEGIPIPEPKREEEKEYSGKFLLRVPKELHRFLVLEAKKNNTTLNQFCIYLLTRKSFLNSISEDIEQVKEDISDVFSQIRNIEYKIDRHKEQFYSSTNMKLHEYPESAWGKRWKKFHLKNTEKY